MFSVTPLTVVAACVNFPSMAVPRRPAPVIRATEIRAAIRPYSIAVAPDSSSIKRLNKRLFNH